MRKDGKQHETATNQFKIIVLKLESMGNAKNGQKIARNNKKHSRAKLHKIA